MEAMLSNPKQMAQMSPDYVGNNLGYGLLGFHAIEYMLFQLNASETESQPRDVSKFTKEETIYLAAIAGDLRNQCIRLEASWAGMDNVTSEKQGILTDAELEPSFNYGQSMLNAGVAGSKYVNYTDAAQELIQGCIDIADEVGQQKIGRPATGTSEEDKNYIESPYSLNSITDFVDNIISIRNAYTGSNDGDKSVSDYHRFRRTGNRQGSEGSHRQCHRSHPENQGTVCQERHFGRIAGSSQSSRHRPGQCPAESGTGLIQILIVKLSDTRFWPTDILHFKTSEK